jgi:hypothetical protein
LVHRLVSADTNEVEVGKGMGLFRSNDNLGSFFATYTESSVRFRYIQVRQMFWLVDLELNEGWFVDRIHNDMFTFKSVSPEHFNILNVKRGTWREGINFTCTCM